MLETEEQLRGNVLTVLDFTFVELLYGNSVVAVCLCGAFPAQFGHLTIEIRQPHNAHVTLGRTQREVFMKDVDRHELFFTARSGENLSFFRESFSALHIKLVLVTKAAHQPAARAGDLRRVEREPLVLCDAEVDRPELREP